MNPAATPILLVKMSSLGDIVHSFPALSEAASHGHRFAWVVEEGFAELAATHPAIDRTHAIALRRWRHNKLASLRPFVEFVQELRGSNYVRVLDAQGLLKSALVTRLSGAAQRTGLSAESARESVASRFYSNKIVVSWQLHAIDRLRQLFGAALGYPVDLEQRIAVKLRGVGLPRPANAEAGLNSKARQQLTLIQGTTWASKEYPLAAWQQVASAFEALNWRVQILSGSVQEYDRAQKIAANLKSADAVAALAPGSLLAAAEALASSDLVVGVDSGLTHLAAVLGVPTVGLFGPTDAQRTGVRGKAVSNLSSNFSCAPCLQRTCSYAGQPVRLDDVDISPPCFAELSVERIVAAARSLSGAGE